MANGQTFNKELFYNRRKKDWVLPYTAWFSESKYQFKMTAKQFRNKLLRDKKFVEEVKKEMSNTQ